MSVIATTKHTKTVHETTETMQYPIYHWTDFKIKHLSHLCTSDFDKCKSEGLKAHVCMNIKPGVLSFESISDLDTATGCRI